MFAKIINDTIEAHPYSPRQDHPSTTFPTGVDHPSFDAYWIHPTEQQNPDPANFNAVETTPVFNIELNRWEQSWEYVEKTPEEKRQAKYNPSTFLMSAQTDADFWAWRSQVDPHKYSELLAAANAAMVSSDWSAFQQLLDNRDVEFSDVLKGKLESLIESCGMSIVINPIPA